jgi:DDE superfamily endonuclease
MDSSALDTLRAFRSSL